MKGNRSLGKAPHLKQGFTRDIAIFPPGLQITIMSARLGGHDTINRNSLSKEQTSLLKCYSERYEDASLGGNY